MPGKLRRTSCDQGETTRQIWIPVAEFAVLRIQGTNLVAHFYKLVKLSVHARFPTVSQRTFRNSDLFLRLKSSQSAESLSSLNLSNSSLIPGPSPSGSPTPVPVDSCCHTGHGHLDVHGPKVTDTRVTLISQVRA